jgi:hypothetical protein
MKSQSGLYRGKDGQQRIWYEPSDIEKMMEDALRASGMLPSRENPAVDIERFIGSLQVRLDQYADLDHETLGLTEFYGGSQPKIFINRDLTGAMDSDDSPPGIRGRCRMTMAHEACHVLMHRILFELNAGQNNLFDSAEPSPQHLMRCFKKNVLLRGGTSDWREVQANKGMAALLMPQSLFRDVVDNTIRRLHVSADSLVRDCAEALTVTAELATLFDVSKQAAGIRLETLGIISRSGQPWLLGGTQN